MLIFGYEATRSRGQMPAPEEKFLPNYGRSRSGLTSSTRPSRKGVDKLAEVQELPQHIDNLKQVIRLATP